MVFIENQRILAIFGGGGKIAPVYGSLNVVRATSQDGQSDVT